MACMTPRSSASSPRRKSTETRTRPILFLVAVAYRKLPSPTSSSRLSTISPASSAAYGKSRPNRSHHSRTHPDERRTVLPQPGFLQGLRDICTKNGALLIFDEVKTGAKLAWAVPANSSA